VHVAMVIADEHRSVQQRARNGFRDLRLAAARNRAWLVAQRSTRPRTDQPPVGAEALFFESHPKSGGQKVSSARTQSQFPGRPRNTSLADTEHRVFGNVENVRILLVDGMTFRLSLSHLTERAQGAIKRSFLQADGARCVE